MLGRLAGRLVTGRTGFLISGLIDLGIIAVYLLRRSAQQRKRALGAVVLVLLVIGAAGALPSSARADATEPSILMDDSAFIYSSPANVEKNLEQVASMGVNTIKVSMVWSLVAPDPDATTKPHFNASNPAAYPAGAWTRYDTLVQEAYALGLNVYFQLTAPAPLWAINPKGVSGREHEWSHEPNAADFEQFVEAVGERYSGGYQVASGLNEGPLPAVNMWGIWNEPNELSWLSPQTRRVDGRSVLESPVLERTLINAGYRALLATGHATDTILIGETASGGNTKPISFLRALFCVNGSYQPLTGTAASLEGCPTDGNGQQFVDDNPGLFAASGWAHHPYSFDHTPATPFKHAPNTITFGNIDLLERALDRVHEAYYQPTGLPIYVTEWGYKTDPPNPYVHTSLGEQETWLDEGWYLSYLNPRIDSMAQELLYDQPPIAGQKPGSAAYWANFDSGLEFADGAPKPAYSAFILPIWLPSQHTGSNVALWAELRPAPSTGNLTGVLEYLAPGHTAWTALEDVTTTSPEGFIDTTVAIPHSGRVRLAWADPVTGTIDYSRTVPIS